MRALTLAASGARHIAGAVTEALLVAMILGGMLVALAPVYAPASWLTDTGTARGGRTGTIYVTFASTTTTTDATVLEGSGSIFSSHGCGFRANNPDYYMVVKGPAPDTTSLAYWVDPFPVDGKGCGSATVSWLGSGVPGDFDVYVVRSPSGNPWQAQPASNIVTITITSP